MTESQRKKIEEAARQYGFYCAESVIKRSGGKLNRQLIVARNRDIKAFIQGAEFALNINCVCAETNPRNCPEHQNIWERESESSGV